MWRHTQPCQAPRTVVPGLYSEYWSSLPSSCQLASLAGASWLCTSLFCSISSISSPGTPSVQLPHWLLLVLLWAQLTCPTMSYAWAPALRGEPLSSVLACSSKGTSLIGVGPTLRQDFGGRQRGASLFIAGLFCWKSHWTYKARLTYKTESLGDPG